MSLPIVFHHMRMQLVPEEEDQDRGQDPVEQVDAVPVGRAVPALARGQEGVLAVVDADVAAAEQEAGGQEAGAGQQRRRR